MMVERGADHCPHCAAAFEIVSVKFRPRRTAMVAACPNCGIAATDDGRGFAKPPNLQQMSKRPSEWLNRRFRHILAFFLAAVIVAALLRHGVHVYGGLSRDEIGEYALIAIPAAVLLFALMRWQRKTRPGSKT